MTPTLVIALCLLFVLTPFAMLLTIIVNIAIADYRERRRQGREVDPADRDFMRLCYVTLLVAMWLQGW